MSWLMRVVYVWILISDACMSYKNNTIFFQFLNPLNSVSDTRMEMNIKFTIINSTKIKCFWDTQNLIMLNAIMGLIIWKYFYSSVTIYHKQYFPPRKRWRIYWCCFFRNSKWNSFVKVDVIQQKTNVAWQKFLNF